MVDRTRGKTDDQAKDRSMALQLVERQAGSPAGRTIGPKIVTFLILFVIWLIISGKFDLFHLSLGVFSCALVSWLSSDLLFSSPLSFKVGRIWLRFALYLPWLIYQVFLSNLHLLYLVFHPRMQDLIDPKIIKFRSTIKDTVGLVTFANSITLTPGTITVYVSVYGEFTVHSIDSVSRDPLPGEMERRIARIFEE